MEVPTVTIEMIKAASSYVLAKSYLGSIKHTIEAIQNDLMDKFKYKWDTGKSMVNNDFMEKYGSYLNKWSMTYLISDKDFDHLMTEYNSAFTKAGFRVAEFGQCPLLCAESEVRDSVIRLCDVMESITGIGHNDFFSSTDWEKNMQKYVDLTIQFLSPYVSVANQATKVMNDKGMKFVTLWRTNTSMGFNFEEAEVGKKTTDGGTTRIAIGTIYK